jgi:hypothetical protein
VADVREGKDVVVVAMMVVEVVVVEVVVLIFVEVPKANVRMCAMWAGERSRKVGSLS